MKRKVEYLFSDYDWHSFVENKKNDLRLEIENYSISTFEEVGTEELKQDLLSNYSFNVPEIKPQEIEVSQQEVDIEQTSDYGFQHNSSYVKGVEVIIHLPFAGDANMLKVQPSSFTSCPPRGDVSEQKIDFSIAGRNLTPDKIKKDIDSNIKSIQQYLGFMTQDAIKYTNQFEALIANFLEQKNKKLLSDKELISSLGYKIKDSV